MATIPAEPKHPIQVVAHRTRLPVDVLRAWERRFRPGIAGGDRAKAVERLRALTGRTDGRRSCGVDPLEAEVWLWYALHKTESPEADTLRTRLLAGQLPALYREFLDDPP